jgi:hypothetical protein
MFRQHIGNLRLDKSNEDPLGLWEEWGEKYQFAAMIALPRGLTLFDFGFILTFGIEDLFFFF